MAQSPSPQLSRARELVADDFAARIELGDLLLAAIPWPDEGDEQDRTAANQAVTEFAGDVGLSAAQARRYRTVAWKIRPYLRELADIGVAISYAAACAALLRSSGSGKLLLEVCRQAAAAGRTRITVTDIEEARRAAARAQMDERRRARTSERAAQVERERDERRAALEPYRAGIDTLVAARLADEPPDLTGGDRDAAESAVVREIAQRIVEQGGNPADLLELQSEVIDRQAHVITAVRKRAGELSAVNRKLNSAESTLERLAGDAALRAGAESAVEQWLATLDRIITHSVDLAERLRDRDDAAQ